MKINFTDPFKQRWARIGLICFIWLLAFPFVLYFVYCWGWWGRDSLLLQHYFQCNCPSGSEKARYPKELEILVSPCSCPCSYHYVNLSPGGRFLYFYEDKLGNGNIRTSLLDLETGQQTYIQSFTSFVTDEIAFKMDLKETGREDYLVDLSTGEQYRIWPFRDLRADAYTDRKLNPQILIDTLQQAKEIYFVDGGFTVVVLMARFPTKMERNFTVEMSDFMGYDLEGTLEQLLVNNSIRYTAIPNGFAYEAASPDGRFVAREDGIYLVATNQKIVDGLPWLHVRGWVSDGSGVIYTAWTDEPCWPTQYVGCKIRVTQPVIKLKVPEMYIVSR